MPEKKKQPKYCHKPKAWRQLRADLRADFLEQIELSKDGKGRLPGCTTVAQSKQRLKDIKAGLATFDKELRAWWWSPSPRDENLQDILGRLTKAEVRYHRRIQAELGLKLSPLLPGMLPPLWWEGRLMPAKVKRRLEKRAKKEQGYPAGEQGYPAGEQASLQ